jgi:hypothetical protein
VQLHPRRAGARDLGEQPRMRVRFPITNHQNGQSHMKA